jgi:hypothetical protein
VIVADDIEPGSAINLVPQCPVDDETIKHQIRYAMQLGLPEFDGEDRKTLHLVANGPSARNLNLTGDTAALNGALSLFKTPPRYWLACDPQALVADFLTNPDQATTYLLASKCHPTVFDRLAAYDVQLWHTNDIVIPEIQNCRRVPAAVSITCCALMLFARMGYRRINIYGWDCSIANDGEHHAGQGRMNNSQHVEIIVGNRQFNTTQSLCAEAQDAVNIIPVLEWMGCEIVIHGNSMIQAIREELQNG